MAKSISITGINIKEVTIAQNDGKVSIGVWYALVDGDGNELNQKRDLISTDQLEEINGRPDLSEILSFAEGIIKTREEI